MEKNQEIGNGFKKGKGNFLDSSPLYTKTDNQITCSGALTKGSWNLRALLHSHRADGGGHHLCVLPAFWIISRAPGWERGRTTSWSGMVCDLWSLQKSKTPMTPLFNTARSADLQDINVGLYSWVLSITFLEFLSGVCFKRGSLIWQVRRSDVHHCHCCSTAPAWWHFECCTLLETCLEMCPCLLHICSHKQECQEPWHSCWFHLTAGLDGSRW